MTCSPPQTSIVGTSAYIPFCVRHISGTPCDMTLSLQNGDTPLMFASSIGHVECVKLLLERGAQANNQDKVSAVHDVISICVMWRELGVECWR